MASLFSSAASRTIRSVTQTIVDKYSGGVLLALTITMAAMFVSEHYGGPVMLYALLLGIAFNFLHDDDRFKTGIQLVATVILKIGVACLGVRITVGEIASLGWPTLILVACGLVFTLTVGSFIGRAFGLKSDHSVLSAGAVAICGASAALAISTVLPRHKQSEQNTIMTVIGVTLLSTIAMVVYPILASALALSDTLAGTFIGATVHDVAQVVGAGYSISDTAGDTSTVVKLMRVTFLAPVVLIVVLVFRPHGSETSGLRKLSLIPLFLIAFVVLVLLNSFGFLPFAVVQSGTELSRWCLIAAIAALGCKTSLGDLVKVGLKPMLVLCAQSLALGGFVLIGLTLCF